MYETVCEYVCNKCGFVFVSLVFVVLLIGFVFFFFFFFFFNESSSSTIATVSKAELIGSLKSLTLNDVGLLPRAPLYHAASTVQAPPPKQLPPQLPYQQPNNVSSSYSFQRESQPPRPAHLLPLRNPMPTYPVPTPVDRLDVTRFLEHQSPLYVEVRRLGVFSYGESTALLGVERVRVTVELGGDEVLLLRRGTHRLHARLVTNDSPPEAQWTFAHQLLMNNAAVDLTQCVRKMRIKQFESPFLTPVPADLTATTNENVNVISFQPVKSSERGIVVVQLVRVRTVDDCVQEKRNAMPSDSAAAITAGQSAAEVQNTLRTLAQRSNVSAHDDDVQEEAFIVSLVDPLALTRIQVPTRGKSCSHLQCFDLRTYVDYSCREQYWHCPVCRKPAPFASLVIDAHFASILAATRQLNDAKVIIERDGTFSRLPSEKDDDSSSKSDDGTRKRALTSSKSAVRDILKNTAAPVLILDDDSDEAVREAPVTSRAAAPTAATTTTTAVPAQPLQPRQPPPPPVAAATAPTSGAWHPAATVVLEIPFAEYMPYLPRVPPPPPVAHAVPPVPVLRTLTLPHPKRARVAPGRTDDVIVLDSSE
jgi:hypothetical protein